MDYALTKDFEAGGAKYQLSRFTARDGSWIVAQFMPAMLGLNEPEKMTAQSLGVVIVAVLPRFSQDVFDGIQQRCFNVCKKYEAAAGGGELAQPLLMADGRWAVKPPPDLFVSHALMLTTLVFNLEPFFAPGALATMREILPPEMTRSSAPTSTDSSGGPS